MPRRRRLVLGLLVVGLGAFPLLIGLGAIKVDPGDVNAPLWVVAVTGLAFVFAGFSLMVGPAARSVLALMIVASIATVATWVAFGPGPRHFTSEFSLPPVTIEGGGDERLGRIVFGFAAVVTWIFFVLAAIKALRDRSRRGSN